VKAKLATGLWLVLTLAACDDSTSDQDQAATYSIGPVKKIEFYSSDGSLNLCNVNQYDSDGYLLTSHEMFMAQRGSYLTCDNAIILGNLTEYTYNNDKTKLYSTSETDNGITSCSTSTFDSRNKLLSKTWYKSSLTHQVCDEEKDTTYLSIKNTYIGKLLNTYSSSNNNGADNEWGTEDDILTSYSIYSYDRENNSETIKNSTDFGNDKIWGTEDDIMGEISTIKTLTPGIPSIVTNTINGEIVSIAKATYENETLVKHIEYSGPGKDKNWQTLADNPISIVFYY